jgi:glucosamine 6-phosphate synthetase-like amidotransferase/phosphosugar isomerase protein
LNSNAFVVGVTDVKRADNPFYYKPTCVLVPGAKKAGWPTQTTTLPSRSFSTLPLRWGGSTEKLSADEADTKHRELFGLPKLMDEILILFRPLVSQIASKFVSTNAVYFIGSGTGYVFANIGGALMARGLRKSYAAVR